MEETYNILDELETSNENKTRSVKLTEKMKQHIRESSISPILKFIYLFFY